jgi:2-dehydropantoate 2-reductase
VAEGSVLIAGAGALGSVVGGLLARAGHPVTLLGRAPHLEAITRDGLVIDGLFGTHRVRGLACVTEPPALSGRFDAVLLTVKAFDTAAMAAEVAPYVASDGVLVSLQNGLGNLEAATRAVGAERVLGGRVIFGAEIVGPGRARVTVFADPVLIGPPGTHDGRLGAAAARWAAALDGAGVPAAPTDRIVATLWEKILYSAALNPLGALRGLTYGELAADPDGRAVMDCVIAEAFAVARAEGVVLGWRDAAAYRQVFYARLVPATASHRSSMLQDLGRGRRTEIDAINGAVAARGAAHGVAAPANQALTQLVRARERNARQEADACSR